MPEEIIHQKHRLSSFQIIISGFVGVILLGALLLMLPVSTTEGCITPFNETLFTATSAVFPPVHRTVPESVHFPADTKQCCPCHKESASEPPHNLHKLSG